MNDWKNEFLTQVMEDVPAGRYRDRLAGELSGHLDELAQTLETGGASPEEARALALEKMGDQEELRRKFRDEFRRREANDPFHCVGVLFLGCFITFVFCIFLGLTGTAVIDTLNYILRYILPTASFIELGGFTYILFALPPVVGAAYLGRAFRHHKHPRHMVTLGLLLSWLGGEFFYIEIGCLFERVPPPFWEMAGWEFRRLLRGEPGAVYQVFLLLLCFVLGWLFGRPKKEDGPAGTAEPRIN